MKVYTHVRVNMVTGEEVHRAYDYDGPVAECKGGGGGGGQGSGKVSYPAYLETHHQQILDDAATDALTYSVADHINTAHGSNPFTGVVAYNPNTIIADLDTEITEFETLVDALAEATDWDAWLLNAVDPTNGIPGKFTATTPSTTSPSTTTPSGDTSGWIDPSPAADDEIQADVDAYEAIVDDHVETDVLPRFQRGMQDINAVMSSAFTIGQAIIEGMADRDVAKYQGDLRTKAYLQKDTIVAQSKLRESERIADLAMQVDEIASREDMQANTIASQESIAGDRILSEEQQLENRAIMQGIQQMLSYFQIRMGAETQHLNSYVDMSKTQIVAEKEETDRQAELDEFEAKWDLDVWQYSFNAMAAIAGAAGGTETKGMSKTQSALSGMMGGAAMGMMAGGPVGAGIGAVAGGMMSML